MPESFAALVAGLMIFVPRVSGCFELPEDRAVLVAGLIVVVPPASGCFKVPGDLAEVVARLVTFVPLAVCCAAAGALPDPRVVDAMPPPSCSPAGCTAAFSICNVCQISVHI